jgi:HEAT repeat protein
MSRAVVLLTTLLLAAPLAIVSGCSGDVEMKVQNLASPNPMVRLETAKLAKRENDPRIATALVPLLQDPSREIRVTAADSLTYVGDTDQVPALTLALKDPEAHVRIAAVNALGRIQDERAVGPLLALLKTEPEPYSVIWALGNIGSNQALEALTPLLEAEDRYVRYQARVALLNLR